MSDQTVAKFQGTREEFVKALKKQLPVTIKEWQLSSYYTTASSKVVLRHKLKKGKESRLCSDRFVSESLHRVYLEITAEKLGVRIYYMSDTFPDYTYTFLNELDKLVQEDELFIQVKNDSIAKAMGKEKAQTTATRTKDRLASEDKMRTRESLISMLRRTDFTEEEVLECYHLSQVRAVMQE